MEVVLHNPRGTKALWLPYLPIHLLSQELVHLDGPILPSGFYEIDNPHRTSQLVSPPDSIPVAQCTEKMTFCNLNIEQSSRTQTTV